MNLQHSQKLQMWQSMQNPKILQRFSPWICLLGSSSNNHLTTKQSTQIALRYKVHRDDLDYNLSSSLLKSGKQEQDRNISIEFNSSDAKKVGDSCRPQQFKCAGRSSYTPVGKNQFTRQATQIQMLGRIMAQPTTNKSKSELQIF